MSTITNYLWVNILLERCKLNIRENLAQDFNINSRKLDKFLQEHDGVIGGYFLIACLLGKNNYEDLDIFMAYSSKDKYFREFIASFYSQPGYFERIPVGLPTKEPQTIEYLLRLKPNAPPLEHKGWNNTRKVLKQIDYVLCDGRNKVPTKPKEFLEKSNIKELSCWYDGKDLYFPFDVYRFVFFDTCFTIKEIGSIHFEAYYDPWIMLQVEHRHHTSWTTKEMEQRFAEYQQNLQEVKAKIKKFNYWIKSDDIMNKCISKEKENCTEYRILKLYYRCLKYQSRGIKIKNLKQFFKP